MLLDTRQEEGAAALPKLWWVSSIPVRPFSTRFKSLHLGLHLHRSHAKSRRAKRGAITGCGFFEAPWCLCGVCCEAALLNAPRLLKVVGFLDIIL